MPDIEYQKIELHSTYDLVKEQERIEYEREAAQRLMMENQIQFAIEIDQKKKKSPTGKSTVMYVLNLIVRKDDVNKVIELLDKEGNFGYYVDLDATYDPMEEIDEKQEVFEEIPEELKEENESTDEDPIKIYGEEDGKVTIEFKPVGMEALANFIMKVTLIFAFSLIYIMEIGLMIYSWNSYDYETITAMVVAMIIETPIFIWFYNILNKKKK